METPKDTSKETQTSEQVVGDEDCFEVVEDLLVLNAVAGTTHTGLSIDDLSLFRDKIILVRLADVRVPSEGLAATGSLGLAGMIASKILVGDRNDKMRRAIASARAEASSLRKSFFGLTIETRMRSANFQAMTIQRAKNPEISHRPFANGGAIELAAEHRTFFMEAIDSEGLYDHLHTTGLYDHLESWLAGTPVRVGGERQGIDLTLPLQGDVLAWLKTPEAVPGMSLASCAQAASIPEYCRVVAKLLKQQPWAERRVLGQQMVERIAPLAGGVGSALRRSPWGDETIDQANKFVAILFAMMVGFVTLTVFGYSSESGAQRANDSTSIFWLGLAFAGVGLLTLILFGFSLRNRSRNLELARTLCASAQEND